MNSWKSSSFIITIGILVRSPHLVAVESSSLTALNFLLFKGFTVEYFYANAVMHKLSYSIYSLSSESGRPGAKGSCEMYGKYIATSFHKRTLHIVRKMDISESQPRMSVSQSGFSVTHIRRWMEDSVL